MPGLEMISFLFENAISLNSNSCLWIFLFLTKKGNFSHSLDSTPKNSFSETISKLLLQSILWISSGGYLQKWWLLRARGFPSILLKKFDFLMRFKGLKFHFIFCAKREEYILSILLRYWFRKWINTPPGFKIRFISL